MRIVVAGPLAASLVAFRGPLLRTMVERGHLVLALAPEADAGVEAELAGWGVRYRRYPLARAGLNPLRDGLSLLALLRAFRRWRPDLALVYAPKPVVYGLLAARIAGVEQRAAMITGIGSALGGTGRKHGAVARLLRWLYRAGLRQAQVVFFQNPDDERLFRSLGLIGPRHEVVRINGSGVDLEHYAVAPLPGGPVTFLMICRLIADKGVREYVSAARLARERIPEARFQLLGPLDVNPTAISAAELESWRAEGVIEYLGGTTDVRPALAAAHVCVLPSYGEGMPRSVLEAMSMGRAIVTTDVPGCRETVAEGENGFLVPARDADALAERMVELANRPDLIAGMGSRSRELAEERFDVRGVNRVIMETLRLG